MYVPSSPLLHWIWEVYHIYILPSISVNTAMMSNTKFSSTSRHCLLDCFPAPFIYPYQTIRISAHGRLRDLRAELNYQE